MLESLYIGATGMQSQQTQVDSISNNLANVNTAGFKKNRVSFEDLLYRSALRTQGPAANASGLVKLGLGSAVSSASKIFTDGELKQTGEPYDIAIQGAGFIEVAMPDGSPAFTRTGNLRVNSDGQLSTVDGHVVRPNLTIPNDATSIVIDATGHVRATVPGSSTPVDVGQLDLVKFTNPAGLNAVGGNLYLATERSGEPIHGKPGDPGFGTVTQGFLEASNVKLIDELVGLVIAQRAYEVNAKVIQASDEMLGLVNNLRR